MMNQLVTILIALIIAGFVFWALRRLIALVPLEPMFRQAIDVIIIIVVAAIVIFYVVLPLLHMLTGLTVNVH